MSPLISPAIFAIMEGFKKKNKITKMKNLSHHDIHEIFSQISSSLDCPECKTQIMPHNIKILDIVNDELILKYSDEIGQIHEEIFDMVVLSVGFDIDQERIQFADRLGISLNKYQFALTPTLNPIETSRPGVYASGIFQGPKDIPSSVMEASASACAASIDLSQARGTEVKTISIPDEMDVSEAVPKIGVFVCDCGINIAGVVDVPAVVEYANTLPNVVFAQENLFSCSQDNQDKMK